MKVVSVEQMRRIEQAANAAGHTFAEMIELAGASIAEAVLARQPEIDNKRVLVLAGTGNNGDDGLVAGRLLAEAGANVSVYLTKERSEEDLHLVGLRRLGALVAVARQDQRARVLKLQLGQADILLDAVLGIGLTLPLKGEAKEVLRTASRAVEQRRSRLYVVAVDCPSGVDCDTGEVASESLRADLTVTLAAAKPGLLRFPAAGHVGELEVGDIGLPHKLEELTSIQIELASSGQVRTSLPVRQKDSHKGTFGRCMLVAGSLNYPGAAGLAGRSAYLVGAGLVTLAVPEPVQSLIASQLQECTWIPMPHQGGFHAENGAEMLHAEWERTQAVLLGPGFGTQPSTLKFLARLLETADDLPSAVADADALKLLTELPEWPTALPTHSILTPHPGEMGVMSGLSTSEIQADRVGIAQAHARNWGHIVVLKGAHTVVAHPDGRATVQPFATPALARAGTGDVLAGIIVGLLAQRVPAYEAAVLGTYIHGRAGELAGEALGTSASVLAGDVASAIPAAIAELERS